RVISGDSHIEAVARARSPGTRYRHYRPDVPVIPFDGTDYEEVTTELAEANVHAWLIMGPGSHPRPEPPASIHTIRTASWTEYGAALYRTLWEAERTGALVILAETPADSTAPGLADRLSRAAEAHYRRGLIREILARPLSVNGMDMSPRKLPRQ
ncbi:MAG: hypothetical protein MI724_16930, partial [Spirochaetales bacterium]|nr:hypothetical protein [Spirochaetales bacterium]